MSSSTTPTTQASRTRRWCDWCGESIEIGERYARWRYYDQGDASTVRTHPECLAAIEETGECVEFDFYSQPRGCNCGHDGHCERCQQREAGDTT